MASLDRAYGYRGAIIALAMAGTAGVVQGTFAQVFDVLWLKLITGLAAVVVLIMAGAISARRSLISAVGLGVLMGLCFFFCRWLAWGLVRGGMDEAVDMALMTPIGWPAYLAAAGISGFWIAEATSMFVPAIAGCVMGHERKA